MDLSTVKDIRLVCQDWADVGASFLGRCAFLNPYKIFQNQDPSHIVPASSFIFNPKLGRHLQISATKSLDDEILSAKASNFLNLCFHVNRFTTDVTLVVDKFTCLQFVEALIRHEFPYLRSIKVIMQQDSGFIGHSDYPQEIAPFPVRPSLKRIVYKLNPLTICSAVIPTSAHPVLPALVNSAPNLQQLVVMDNFYPALENCRKLSSLKLVGAPVTQKPFVNEFEIHNRSYSSTYLSNENFRAEKFLMAIIQVQERVRELFIGICVEDYWDLPRTAAVDFELPCLPNLNSMEVDGIHIFCKIMNSLNSQVLSNVKSLTLREHDGFKLETVVRMEAYRLKAYSE